MTKSPEIYAALRKRYCAPEWALFFEVANGTGSSIRRYADAVAMNLFPSRGLSLNGFEIKTYRSDWQREVKYRTEMRNDKLKRIAEIEAELGVSLTDYKAHEGYGRILRAIDKLGVTKSYGNLCSVQKQLEQMAADLKAHIDEFDQAAPLLKPDKEEAA